MIISQLIYEDQSYQGGVELSGRVIWPHFKEIILDIGLYAYMHIWHGPLGVTSMSTASTVLMLVTPRGPWYMAFVI